MTRNIVETVLGALVLVAGLAFLLAAYNTADLRQAKGYSLEARFFKIGGLQEGNEVRIGGIKVGTVSSVNLDQETYDAVAKMTVDPRLKLPVDSVVTVASDGLLGGQYVNIQPGSETDTLQPGGSFEQVQDWQSLEDIIGDIIF